MFTVIRQFLSNTMAGGINLIAGYYIRKLPRITKTVLTTILLFIMGAVYCIYSSNNTAVTVPSVAYSQQLLGG